MERKYRDRERRENLSIIIPVIICPIVRAQGIQYTKRLLPDFLIPHSVIRLDFLLDAADLPKPEQTEEAICDRIGCLDPRTARLQMRRLTTAIETVSLELARRRVTTPELGNLPEISPGTSPEQQIAILFDSEIRAGQRGGKNYRVPQLRQLLQAAMRNCGAKKPSNCVFSHAQPP